MSILDNFFQNLLDLHSTVTELAAIWIDRPVQTSEGVRLRIAPEMMIRVVEGKIQNQGELTHKVIGCYGTLYNQFEISVIDLKTSEPSIIKL